MEQGLEALRSLASPDGFDAGGRRYETPELLIYGSVEQLTLGPAGALTDFPEPGYSFAE
jgi:hypothetical protein